MQGVRPISMACKAHLSGGVDVVPDGSAVHAQDIMYKPIGLECGHKFCADCAFTCGLRALPHPVCMGVLLTCA